MVAKIAFLLLVGFAVVYSAPADPEVETEKPTERPKGLLEQFFDTGFELVEQGIKTKQEIINQGLNVFQQGIKAKQEAISQGLKDLQEVRQSIREDMQNAKQTGQNVAQQGIKAQSKK